MTQGNNTQLVSYEAERLARINDVAEELAGIGIPSYSFKDRVLYAPSGSTITTKEIDVIILTDPWDISVFGETYNPSNTTPPIAKAYGMSYDKLIFSEDSQEGYAGVPCKEHPACQYGSSLSGGNGKMAREKRKLLFITADRLKNGVENLSINDVFSLYIPPTTLTPYAKYLKSLPKASYVADFVTRIRINPMKDTSLDFNIVSTITEGRDVLWGLVKEVEEVVLSKEANKLPAQEEVNPKKRKF